MNYLINVIKKQIHAIQECDFWCYKHAGRNLAGQFQWEICYWHKWALTVILISKCIDTCTAAHALKVNFYILHGLLITMQINITVQCFCFVFWLQSIVYLFHCLLEQYKQDLINVPSSKATSTIGRCNSHCQRQYCSKWKLYPCTVEAW